MIRFTMVVRFLTLLMVGAPVVTLSAQGNDAALTVVLVRHAERAAEPANDPDLSDAGRERVRELVRLLEGATVTAVLSTQFNRTQQTGGPVARAHGVDVETIRATRGGDHVADVVRAVRTHGPGEVVLVAGHSNTIPAIVNALAGTELPNLGENDYDRLYIVTIANPGGPGALLTLRYGRGGR